MPFKKGESGNKKGRPQGAIGKKRNEWEAMGDALVGPWTDYIKAEGFRMMQEGNWEEFYPLYKDMVNYFKPKLSSAQLEAKVDTYIKLVHPDDDMMEKI